MYDLRKRIFRCLWYYTNKNRFVQIHKSNIIIKPILITPSCISLGEYTYIRNSARIEGIYQKNGIRFKPKIIIGKNVGIEQGLHLTCANKISIGDYTSISANVTITDIHHPYDDIDTPIERQNLVVKPVKIGNDCKIYNNAVILPGTIIGKHVTVGANSVVSGNFPDYCVIVGVPAKIVKRYDFCTCRWRKTSSKGDFEEQ